jgi:hypothetical protein
MNFIFYSLWLTNFIVCWILLTHYLKLRSPIFSFWLIILISFILPSFLDPFLTRIDGHPFAVAFDANIDTLIISQLIATASLLLFYLLLKIFPVSETPSTAFKNPTTSSSQLIWAGILVFSTGFALKELIEKFGLTFFLDFSFTDRREGLSFASQFFLSYNLMAAAGLPCLLYLKNMKSLGVLVAIFYLAVFGLLGGSRQPLVAVILPFFALFLFNSKHPRIRLATFLLVSQILLSVFSILLVLRYQTSINDKLALVLNPSELLELSTSQSEESSLRFAFYYFIENARSFEEFGGLQYFGRTLLFWLPSSIDFLNIKPDDFEYVMFAKYMRGEIGTLHPTFFGSIFADGLYLFPIWILLIHLVFFLFSRILVIIQHSGFTLLLWTVFSITGVMLARGALYGPLVISCFSIIYYFVGSLITTKIKFR